MKGPSRLAQPPIRNALHLPSLARALPGGWRWMRLDEVCSGIYDCPHSTPTLAAEGPFLARSQDILSGSFRFEDAARVSEETYTERIVRAEPVYGDLLYSREGTYFGIAAEVPKDSRVCLGQRMVLLRPDAKRVSFRFLRYWLNSPVLAAYIHGHRDGTVAERLNLPTIRRLPIPVAPMSQQAAIAFTLGDLDDKIESNRRTNETLEALARAIFKSWFVDFDPVRAKAKGHQPSCMDTATAALFADSFEDSPLGNLPEGWRAGKLDDMIAIYGGGTPNTSVREFWNGTVPWFSVVDAPRPSDVFVINTEKRITEAGVENSSAKILPAGTVVISARGTVGRLAMLGRPMAINQSCYGIRPKNGSGERFTFFCLKHKIAELSQSTHGTVFDTITRDTFRIVPCVIPPDTVIQRFEETVAPFLERINSNLVESQTLSDIRDVLLPKLLSGTIRVAPCRHAEVAQP